MARHRDERVQERARTAFALYVQLGPGRSLRQLHQQLSALGVTLSLATLKRYSTSFRWRDEIARLEREAAARGRDAAADHVVAMQDRHAQLARAVQGAGGSALQKLLRSDNRLASMRPAEIARLLELGLRAERSAVGEATERRDIATAIWNAVTTEMVDLFMEVNNEDDTQARGRLFAKGVDRIVDQRLDALRRSDEAGDER